MCFVEKYKMEQRFTDKFPYVGQYDVIYRGKLANGRIKHTIASDAREARKKLNARIPKIEGGYIESTSVQPRSVKRVSKVADIG